VHRKLDELVDMFGAFLGASRAVRRLGSAALDLCYVAAGRFDGFWEQFLKPWDVAAGALIVAEAGGESRGWMGRRSIHDRPISWRPNGPLHGEMLAVIAARRQARSGRNTDGLTGPVTVGPARVVSRWHATAHICAIFRELNGALPLHGPSSG
jgi:hypothetical protein